MNEAPPHLMSVHSSFDVSFLSRDFYNNDITIGYGDDAFNAWVYQTTGENRPTPVYDNQDGSYSVRMQTDNTTGTVFLFIQRHRLNIPGSPFEVRETENRALPQLEASIPPIPSHCLNLGKPINLNFFPTGSQFDHPGSLLTRHPYKYFRPQATWAK